MEIKITKKEKLLEISNCWIANDYWLIHGRIYNDEHTAFYRFKFVQIIDRADDLWDSDAGKDRDYKEVLEELAWCFCDQIGDKFDTGKISSFIDACNDTIRNFWKIR